MTAQLAVDRRPARVRPGLLPALIVFVVYVVVVIGGGKVIGHDIKFNAYTETIENFRKGVVYPVGIAALMLIVVTTWFGWWKPAAGIGTFPHSRRRAAPADHRGMTINRTEPMQILDRDECAALLEAADVGRLAVAIMNEPDIFPVNYVVDHGAVVFRTAEGTKLAAAVLGRAVAFEVDGHDVESGDAWSVVVKGQAVEIEQMYALFEAEDLPLYPWHAGYKHRFVRIEPRQVTGRRFAVDPEVPADRRRR